MILATDVEPETLISFANGEVVTSSDSMAANAIRSIVYSINLKFWRYDISLM
jgi:hypothetical protein